MNPADEPKEVANAAHQSYPTADYSDLTIICKELEFKVHKLVVCSAAEFFAKALKFGGKETETSTVDLSEEEPELVRLLIQYLYEKDYKPYINEIQGVECELQVDEGFLMELRDKNPRYPYAFPHTCSSECDTITRGCPHVKCCSPLKRCICHICIPDDKVHAVPNETCKPDHLFLHANMYLLGDKYFIDHLKRLAAHKFRLVADRFWNHEIFPDAADFVLTNVLQGDKIIKQRLVEIITRRIELALNPTVRDLISDHDLAHLIFQAQLAEKQKAKEAREREREWKRR